MKVLVLAATSATGILLVRDLLEAGHSVVVYVRNPAKIPDDLRTSITVIEGQITDKEGICGAMAGADAVISLLGPDTSTLHAMHHYTRDTPLAKAYELIIACMRELGVRRLIALSTISWKDKENDKFSLALWLMVWGVWLVATGCYKEMVAIGDTVTGVGKDLDLEWTVVRVPMLTYAPTKFAVVGYVGDGKSTATLSRAAFAAWVTRELEEGQWKWKTPYLSDPHNNVRAFAPPPSS